MPASRQLYGVVPNARADSMGIDEFAIQKSSGFWFQFHLNIEIRAVEIASQNCQFCQ